MKVYLRAGNGINYLLLILSFLGIGWSGFLLYDTIYLNTHSVSFENGEHTPSEQVKSTSEPDQLPSRTKTVRVIRNDDFGPVPEEDEEQVSTQDSPCSAKDYVKTVLHLHTGQGVHVQFHNGSTKYLILDSFYTLPSAQGSEKGNFSEIAFSGTTEEGMLFEFRTDSVDSNQSNCTDRFPMEDSDERANRKNSSSDSERKSK